MVAEVVCPNCGQADSAEALACASCRLVLADAAAEGSVPSWLSDLRQGAEGESPAPAVEGGSPQEGASTDWLDRMRGARRPGRTVVQQSSHLAGCRNSPPASNNRLRPSLGEPPSGGDPEEGQVPDWLDPHQGETGRRERRA